MTTGDAWRYCAHLDNPEAVKQLVQAVLTAHATIVQAQTSADPEDFATALDWDAVRGELHHALRAVGHPAGD
ncbi:hypothetical protein ACFOHU_06840 [Ottowia pentelensis]|uniref:Uncharacterized protein n=1 Tax=Ottowia pentelensis TaxID=511108 RepID=A0ABV6PT79_9BURK